MLKWSFKEPTSWEIIFQKGQDYQGNIVELFCDYVFLGLELGRICGEGCVYNKDEVNKKGKCRKREVHFLILTCFHIFKFSEEACLKCKEEFNCVKGKCVDGN